MKINVETKALNAGISTVIKSLSSKPTLPILEGIYMEANMQGVLLRCSDLSLQIECTIPAIVEEEGEIVLPGRLFSEIVRKISSEQIDMQLTDKTMQVKGGRTRSTLQCMDAKDFPNLMITGEVTEVKLPQNVCKDMIRQTVFACAQEDSKPILTGVLCEIKEDIFRMVALDGFRLALRTHRLPVMMEEKEVVVPAKSFMEISRTLIDTDDLISMQITRTHLSIDMGHTKVVSRLLDGEFIKYRTILPKDHTSRVRVRREELLESIDRAILLAREGNNNLVRFMIEHDQLNIYANSPLGKLEEEISIHLNGDDLEIAFNAKYFSDMLKTLDDEEIFLDMNSSVSPCVVKPIQGDHYYYLILPVRIFS
ncbi:DNA polymerase III subunit beta [Christensenellaceae bacterium OttesenSCG-928-L17]|nr:DNA polymerase III subunit beta [Christensenellaceae bacterium OttesenSCG-928-L17]